MPERRNIFLHGLSLTLQRLPALLWTYVFNLLLAFLFSISLNRQLSKLLNHSLATQRLSSGFDLGTIGDASIPLFLIVYFLLVPGTLFCYQTDTPARLGTLLQQGLLYFWRFVRITLLTLLVSVLILAGNIVLFLLASILRLYFDLVEVYTVQLGQHLRPALFGHQTKPDRRVRRTLGPAWRALRTH